MDETKESPRRGNDRGAPGQSTTTATTASVTQQPPAGQSAARRASSLWMQIAAWRKATPEQRRAFADAIAAAKRDAERRRTRVLAHPDIAQRLVTDLGYSRAERWTGYVPPKVAYYADGDAHPANTSEVRRVLIDILRAVVDREAAQHAPDLDAAG